MTHRWLGLLLVTGCAFEPGTPDNGTPAPGAPVIEIVDGTLVSTSNLAIEPAAIAVPAGRNQIFVASAPATWAVAEPGGGTIDANGQYIAPAIPGTYHVVATSGTDAAIATIVVEQMDLVLVTGGIGGFGNVDGVGDNARFASPLGVAFDGAHTLYIAEGSTSLIRALDLTTREVTTLASGFTFAMDVVVDRTTSTLYVADTSGTISAIDLTTHAVTTIAGVSGSAGTTNGPGVDARFKVPHGLCIVGSTLYIAETNAHDIRTLDLASSTHEVALFAGQPGMTGFADSADPMTASFNNPTDLACTATTLYVTDYNNSAIRTVDIATGAVGTLATTTTPVFIEADPSHGRLFVDDWTHGVIRTVDLASHAVTTLVGDPTTRGYRDGSDALLWAASGMATDGQTLWFGDNSNYSVRAVDVASANVSTLAGRARAPAGDVDGTFAQASFSGPTTLVADATGTVYVSANYAVRTLSFSAGTVQRLAGKPGVPGRQDGGPQVATLAAANGLLANPDGTLWATDHATIREIGSDGSITTRFGDADNPADAVDVDAVGLNARLAAPSSIVRVGDKVVVLDMGGHTIRAIDSAGMVTTLAGVYGQHGHVDGIGAAARLETPYGIATDGLRTVWFGEWGAHAGATIRELDLATNTVTTIAGTSGVLGDLEDGIGTAAHLSGPFGLAYDGHGSLYVADTGADRLGHGTGLIRRIWIPSHAVSTYAGVRGRFGAAPGPLQSATIAYPVGLAITPSGVLMFTGENGIFSIVRE